MRIYSIELTNRCNATCSYCPTSTSKRVKTDMTKEVFLKSLDLLGNDLVEGDVGLHGFGEILLVKDFFWYLDELGKRKIPWSVSSNGILLGIDEIRDKRLLSYSSENTLQISLENINSKITMEDKYRQINQFLKWAEEIGSELSIEIIGYGGTLFENIIGNYKRIDYVLHSWGENGETVDGVNCDFFEQENFVILSDGRIVACCFDCEGESAIYGTVFNPIIQKHIPWRKCKTCELNIGSGEQ